MKMILLYKGKQISKIKSEIIVVSDFLFYICKVLNKIKFMSFKYRIINGEIILCEYVCKSISEFPTYVIIPESINGYPVTKISGSLFAYKYPLVEVVIPDSIKHMDYYSFYDCKNLTTINGIKLKRGVNIINNRFIFDCNMVYKITCEICDDYITIYGDDKMYFINNRIFTDNLTEII